MTWLDLTLPAGTKPRTSHHRSPGVARRGNGKPSMIFFRRTRKGHRQSDQHWNCFKVNIGETPERLGGAHMGLPECLDTICNWTELNCMGHSESLLLTDISFTSMEPSVVPDECKPCLFVHASVWYFVRGDGLDWRSKGRGFESRQEHNKQFELLRVKQVVLTRCRVYTQPPVCIRTYGKTTYAR